MPADRNKAREIKGAATGTAWVSLPGDGETTILGEILARLAGMRLFLGPDPALVNYTDEKTNDYEPEGNGIYHYVD